MIGGSTQANEQNRVITPVDKMDVCSSPLEHVCTQKLQDSAAGQPCMSIPCH